MAQRTAAEALEMLLHSIKLSTEEADETRNPLAMVYHYDSMIVRVARRALEAEKMRM